MVLLLVLACAEPPSPAPPSPSSLPTPVAPVAPVAPPAAFDCAAWASDHKLAVGQCGESAHVPGLWLIHSPNGGDVRHLAVRNGVPLKGGAAAVAAFLRTAEVWAHPVDANDIAGVLDAFRSYPPGFTNTSPRTFEAPFTYRLTSSLADWSGQGGSRAVAGAAPEGPDVRASLTGAADAPIQWVIESGKGASWAPVATIQWDRGPQ